MGMAMLGLGLWSGWLRLSKKMYQTRLFLYATTFMGPAGLIAILAGWMTTEIGRQPWVVYGVMRTAAGVSKHSVSTLAISLALFIIVYLFVFGLGVGYVLRLIKKGPVPHEGDLTADDDNNVGGIVQNMQPMRPMSIATEKA